MKWQKRIKRMQHLILTFFSVVSVKCCFQICASPVNHIPTETEGPGLSSERAMWMGQNVHSLLIDQLVCCTPYILMKLCQHSQGLFYVCVQLMRYSVTLKQKPSYFGCKHRTSPVLSHLLTSFKIMFSCLILSATCLNEMVPNTAHDQISFYSFVRKCTLCTTSRLMSACIGAAVGHRRAMPSTTTQ